MIDPVLNPDLTFRRRWKHVIFLLLRIFVLPTLRITLRFKVYGLENVPRRGGALIVGNHVHNADPILMLSASPRPILWMAKAEVWELPILRWFASQAGAFPVNRGRPDRRAIKVAVDTIQEGLLVGMYPEGTRSVTGGLKEPHPGVGLVAVRAGAPIIPCVIVGSEELPLNGKKQTRKLGGYPKVSVVFGRPFRLMSHRPDGTRYTLEELSEAIMIELARLLPTEMRGLWADHDLQQHESVQREHISFPGG